MEVVPLTTAIGAEIRGIDLRQPLDDHGFAAVHRAFLEHQVLFFRDQHLAPEQQMAFAARFGPLDTHAFARSLDAHPEVVVLDQSDPRADDANHWHADATFMPDPPLGSVLQAVQLPDRGGDTCWSSMYAAYDALSPPMQRLVAGLRAEHDIYGQLEKAVRLGHTDMDLDAVRRQWQPFAHPVVVAHPETGRRLLYVNGNWTTRIVGVGERESEELLGFLCEHVASPDFQVRFTWEPGSIAFWDNRCTQHYPVADYAGRRVMHRVTVRGGPLAAAA